MSGIQRRPPSPDKRFQNGVAQKARAGERSQASKSGAAPALACQGHHNGDSQPQLAVVRCQRELQKRGIELSPDPVA
jgi:hypothetical protein